MPAMRGQDMETEVDYDVPSPSTSFQKTITPTTGSVDVMMTGQDATEVPMQGRDPDVTAEIQLISEKEFNKTQGPQPDNDLAQDLRSANKRQRNKRQRTKIKSLEEAAEKFEEDIADADLHLQCCEGELEDATKKLAESEQALQRTKAQLFQQTVACKSLTEDLAASRQDMEKCKDNVRKLEASNGDIHDKLVATGRELSRCKDDLFSMQPLVQTPDSVICREFESVGQQIIHWVEAEVAAFEKAYPQEKLDYIFSVGQDKYASTFLRQNPGAGEHLARYLIHRFLGDNLFGKKMYLLGLKGQTTHMLREAESTMASLDPPRDPEKIALWRSETLKALCATTECKENGKRQLQDLNSRLFRELSSSLPRLFSSHERTCRFYSQVMVPAAKLAATIRMSTSDYVFSIPRAPLTKFMPATTDMLKTHKMIDYKSGRQLKPDSAVVADEDGMIGDLILSLEPGLYRVIKGKKTTLHQELFLVELHHPLGKRSKAPV